MTRTFLLAAILVVQPLAAQTGMLEGRVLNSASGQGVSRARVAVRNRTESYAATTDSNGVFRILGVEPGEYALAAERSGWVPDAAAPAGLVKVAPRQQVTGIEIRLVATGVIAGRVLDEDGDPISRATVEALQYRWLRGRKTLRSTATRLTNDRGEFRVFGLLPGSYYVRGSRTSYTAEPTVPVFYPAATTVTRAALLDLPPGAELGSLEIRLVKPVAYSLRVRFPDGFTASDFGKRISIMPLVTPTGPELVPSSGVLISSFTDSGFLIRNLIPRRYSITMSMSDPEIAGRRLLFHTYVDIADHDVEIQPAFRPGFELSGSVEGASARVSRLDLLPLELPAATGMTALPEDRTFTFRDLLPDTYDLRLTVAGAYLKQILLEGRKLPSQQLDLAANPGRLTIVLGDDGGEIAGLAVDSDGKPIPRAAVALAPVRPGWPDLMRTAAADPNGNFRLENIAPGDYRLFAWRSVPQGASEDPEFRLPYESKAQTIRVASGSEQTMTVTAFN